MTLRQLAAASPDLYGRAAPDVRSEAVIRLDLGRGTTAASSPSAPTDGLRFHPDQGTDLLAFLGGVFERSLRRRSFVTVHPRREVPKGLAHFPAASTPGWRRAPFSPPSTRAKEKPWHGPRRATRTTGVDCHPVSQLAT